MLGKERVAPTALAPERLRTGEQRAPESKERVARCPRWLPERARTGEQRAPQSKERRVARPSAFAPDTVAAGVMNALYSAACDRNHAPIQDIPINRTNLYPVLGSVLAMLSHGSPIPRLGVAKSRVAAIAHSTRRFATEITTHW